jgi:hypothetical protein
MKYVIEHAFDGLTPAEYEALFFDETFNVALSESMKLGRTLVKLERTPQRIVRHVRCEPKREPGSAGAKLFGDAGAGWFDELEYDVGKFQGRWRTVPTVMTDKVKTHGTLEFVATPSGVKQRVTGEINVGIFGVGRLVEKTIVAGVEKGYSAAAEFTAAWARKSRAAR